MIAGDYLWLGVQGAGDWLSELQRERVLANGCILELQHIDSQKSLANFKFAAGTETRCYSPDGGWSAEGVSFRIAALLILQDRA